MITRRASPRAPSAALIRHVSPRPATLSPQLMTMKRATCGNCVCLIMAVFARIGKASATVSFGWQADVSDDFDCSTVSKIAHAGSHCLGPISSLAVIAVRDRICFQEGCFSYATTPSGMMTQGCFLMVHKCISGFSQRVSSSVPGLTDTVSLRHSGL